MATLCFILAATGFFLYFLLHLYDLHDLWKKGRESAWKEANSSPIPQPIIPLSSPTLVSEEKSIKNKIIWDETNDKTIPTSSDTSDRGTLLKMVNDKESVLTILREAVLYGALFRFQLTSFNIIFEIATIDFSHKQNTFRVVSWGHQFANNETLKSWAKKLIENAYIQGYLPTASQPKIGQSINLLVSHKEVIFDEPKNIYLWNEEKAQRGSAIDTAETLRWSLSPDAAILVQYLTGNSIGFYIARDCAKWLASKSHRTNQSRTLITVTKDGNTIFVNYWGVKSEVMKSWVKKIVCAFYDGQKIVSPVDLHRPVATRLGDMKRCVIDDVNKAVAKVNEIIGDNDIKLSLSHNNIGEVFGYPHRYDVWLKRDGALDKIAEIGVKDKLIAWRRTHNFLISVKSNEIAAITKAIDALANKVIHDQTVAEWSLSDLLQSHTAA